MSEIKKPNFFIVGAAKAGTTALWHYLTQHPDIFLSEVKEPHFFFKEKKTLEFREEFKKKINVKESNTHQQFINSEENYLKLFKNADAFKVIGEASASYLYSKEASKAIFNFNPDSRIIIILRNPIERAFSHYIMNLRMGFSELPFKEDFIADCNKEVKGWGQSHLYLELGLYSDQIKRYFNIFPINQIKIVWSEDLKLDTQNELDNICDFLSISKYFFNTKIEHNKAMLPKNRALVNNLKSANLSQFLPKSFVRIVRNLLFQSKNLPKLEVSDRELLSKYFSKDISELENYLNRDLSSWYK